MRENKKNLSLFKNKFTKFINQGTRNHKIFIFPLIIKTKPIHRKDIHTCILKNKAHIETVNNSMVDFLLHPMTSFNKQAASFISNFRKAECRSFRCPPSIWGKEKKKQRVMKSISKQLSCILFFMDNFNQINIYF